MQAVILAAGRGSRMGELTRAVPKPLLEVGGMSLLERSLRALPASVDEAVLVVGYLKERIKRQFGHDFLGRRIRYVEQNELLGSAHALFLCREFLGRRLLVLNADDIYAPSDIAACCGCEHCVLAQRVNGGFAGGRIRLDEQGRIRDVEEGRFGPGQHLVGTGLYVLTDSIFDYEMVKLNGKNEYGLPQTIAVMAQDKPVEVKEASFWLQINDPSALEAARKRCRQVDKYSGSF